MENQIRNKVDPNAPNFPIFGYSPQEDEVSLADLWAVLAKRKKLILSISAAVVISALVYVLLAPPVYKAEAVIMPPTASDIEPLHIAGIEGIGVEAVFTLFRSNLEATYPRQKVFIEMGLQEIFQSSSYEAKEFEILFDEFNQELAIAIVDPAKRKSVETVSAVALSFKGEDPVLAAEIVNRIIAEVQKVTATELVANLTSKIRTRVTELTRGIHLLRAEARKERLDEINRLEAADALEIKSIKDKLTSLREKARHDRLFQIIKLEEADQIERANVEEEIASLRDSAKAKRLDKIAFLKESAAISRALGIRDPIGFKLKKINDSSPASSQILTSLSDNSPEPYTRGYEALEAESASLIARENDDPFIPTLRGLEIRLDLLTRNEKIEALKNRKNDDPFIAEIGVLQERLKLLEVNRKAEQLRSRDNDDPFIASLREQESQLARLELIRLGPEDIVVARLDQAAFPPDKKIGPRRSLIMLGALFVAGILGLLAALLAESLQASRSRRRGDATPARRSNDLTAA